MRLSLQLSEFVSSWSALVGEPAQIT
jgi:hypothetical protein